MDLTYLHPSKHHLDKIWNISIALDISLVPILSQEPHLHPKAIAPFLPFCLFMTKVNCRNIQVLTMLQYYSCDTETSLTSIALSQENVLSVSRIFWKVLSSIRGVDY